MVDELKKIFKGRKIFKSALEKFLASHLDIKEELEKELEKNPEWISVKNLVYGLVNDMSLSHCKVCGKTLPFSRKPKRYCSSKSCMMKDPDLKNRIGKSCREHFQKKYGVDNPWKLKEVQEKNKKHFIEKYGVDNPWKIKSVIEKIKKSRDEVANLKKRRDTLKRKFNVTNPSKLPEVIQKIKAKTDPYYKEKFRQNLEKWSQYVVPLFDDNEIEIGTNKTYRWKCVKCGNEFEQRIYTTGHIKGLRNCPRCLKCYPLMNRFSVKELKLQSFCKQFFNDILINDRHLIHPFELDIVIPEIHLALEFNGNFWHSIEGWDGSLDRYYGRHLHKTKLCNEKGYRLIHIWEDEWTKSPEDLKSRLEKVFLGTEDLSFSGEEVILDRSWYNCMSIPGYELIEELPPKIVVREGYEVEDCGWLKLKKLSHQMIS